MATPDEFPRARRAPHPFEHSANLWLRDLLLGRSAPGLLFLVSAVPVIGAVAVLLAPGVLFSRAMTWDLLFNLAGAWRVVGGQQPHVDFHDPLGSLGFHLTRAGFALVGPGPRAFLVGEIGVLVVLFVAAFHAAVRRLPPIPAATFVIYTALLVILPVNVGDLPNAYSFAMSYNRWGWSALTTLCLLLFVEPERRSAAWTDALVGAGLLFIMFYVKITFAAAGVAAVVGALIWASHVRRSWMWWAANLAVLMLDAVAPHNRAYLIDIWQAGHSGYLKLSAFSQVYSFLANRTEYALNGTAVLVLFLLWRAQRIPAQAVLSAVTVFVLGILVLSQNSQTSDIPVTIVITLILYDALRRQRANLHELRTRDLTIILLVVLAAPLLAATSEIATLAGYARVASRTGNVWRIAETNLRGLAVPTLGDEIEDLFAPSNGPSRYGPHGELTQAQYVHTLVDGAAEFAGDRRGRVRILVLDQVNPMPFVLGYPSPRGHNLWFGPESPPTDAETLFGDVDVVMVPRYSTNRQWTAEITTRYADDLARRFPAKEETASWTILSRR